MPIVNPRWPPKIQDGCHEIFFFFISTSDRGDFTRIIVIDLFVFCPLLESSKITCIQISWSLVVKGEVMLVISFLKAAVFLLFENLSLSSLYYSSLLIITCSGYLHDFLGDCYKIVFLYKIMWYFQVFSDFTLKFVNLQPFLSQFRTNCFIVWKSLYQTDCSELWSHQPYVWTTS